MKKASLAPIHPTLSSKTFEKRDFTTYILLFFKLSHIHMNHFSKILLTTPPADWWRYCCERNLKPKALRIAADNLLLGEGVQCNEGGAVAAYTDGQVAVAFGVDFCVEKVFLIGSGDLCHTAAAG